MLVRHFSYLSKLHCGKYQTYQRKEHIREPRKRKLYDEVWVGIRKLHVRCQAFNKAKNAHHRCGFRPIVMTASCGFNIPNKFIPSRVKLNVERATTFRVFNISQLTHINPYLVNEYIISLIEQYRFLEFFHHF